MMEWIKLIPSVILLIAGLLYIGRSANDTTEKAQDISTEFRIPKTTDDPDQDVKEAEQVLDSVAKVEPPKAAPSSQPNKPSTRWTYPGDLGSHLRTTHGVDVTGLSHSDMLAIHDGIHNSALADDTPRNLVVPHFASWCSVCKSDKASIFPKWLKAGWSLADPIDETSRPLRNVYPWYEIYDEKGKVTVHLGSLGSFKKK